MEHGPHVAISTVFKQEKLLGRRWVDLKTLFSCAKHREGDLDMASYVP